MITLLPMALRPVLHANVQVLDEKVLLSSSSAVALAAISIAGGQRP